MNMLTKFFLVATFVFSGQLMASGLSSAKDAGLIGEQADGYIGFVTAVPADVTELVNDVNKKRMEHYKKIAVNQKISLSDVSKIAGKKAIEKTEPGNYIKRLGEGWTKK